jgi:hypothetical protein
VSATLYAANLAGVATATLAMVVVVAPLRIALTNAGLGSVGVLALVVGVGMALYIPLCLRLVPDVRVELGRARAALRSRS